MFVLLEVLKNVQSAYEYYPNIEVNHECNTFMSLSLIIIIVSVEMLVETNPTVSSIKYKKK